MAKTDTLNIRIEPNLKEQAEETLNYLGLTMSEAVTLFFKQVVINEGIPFEIKKPKYNKTTQKAMREAERLKKKLEKHPEKVKVYNDFDELWEDLEN